ncbi:MAG: fused MFS/spermidine synthase [Gammaproteobacteria bacterium]
MPATPRQHPALLILLFALTLFGSAALMFILQPMFGKILLPLLGGSPSVWNTCMVFYQALLFLGYLYAHFLAGRCKAHQQIMIHAAVLLISLIALPLALPENAAPPTESNPTGWLLGMLFVSIGLPFFVVSTTAPLLQKWFSELNHHASGDPYFLYAASNAGSLIALLSYPFVLEPHIGLQQQTHAWGYGYVLLGILILSCGAVLWRRHADTPIAEEPLEIAGIARRTILHWLALAFVPSSLLLGLTNFISTDIAAVPLLWIIPLTLYLLTFILAFSHWGAAIHPWMLRLQPLVLLPLIAFSFINPAVLPYWINLALHSLAFFLAAMVCHGELAKARPHTGHLTLYYLTMSFAGMLGGMFNTFVAPLLFNAVYEYPIMIAGALLLRPGAGLTMPKQWLTQTAAPAALLIGGLSLYAAVDALPDYLDTVGVGLILLAGLSYSFRAQPITLGLFTGMLLFFTFGLHSLLSNVLFQQRTFFGVHSVRAGVMADERGQPEPYHELYHGTTKHGAELLDPADLLTPLMYYSRSGPMGQLFSEFDAADKRWSIGAVGLGAGALVCYSKPDQQWTIFEIDPTVIAIARNPDYFSFLSRCGRNLQMRVGDARLSLQKEAAQKFDLLILDAFSSDAVPTHLLTQEALQLYLSKLKPGGLLAFHITNRHLALKKVLADHVQKMRLAGLLQEYKAPPEMPLVSDADWAVIAARPENLVALKNSRLGRWQELPLTFGMKSWSDDFTNILSIWKEN